MESHQPPLDALESDGTTFEIDKRELQNGEGAQIYGDAEMMAEKYGCVSRGLKSRHIQFIALGGTIGTGLFIGIGKALTKAGPLSVLLGYSITGVSAWAMMMCLGEMATWLPLPGAIPQFCARYVDPAMGFAVGWNQWYQCAITLCAEISAASLVIQFWDGARDINVAAWISIIIILIIILNIFAVTIYGEAEFIFASLKIVTILGLLIMAFCVDLGANPRHDRIGFRYWENPGAMRPYIADGATGRFLGLFSTLINAAFSYVGVESVACAAGEAANPRKNIPKACRRVFWRILFFYVLGALAIGVLVPYDSPMLLSAQKSGVKSAAASPWVIAIYDASIPALPHIINAVILSSASSSANAFLYSGSRYLYALAQNRQAPRFLLTCSKSGVPYYCVMITASISLLTFMSCSSGSSTVFEWFQNLTTIAGLFTWSAVCVAYIRFHRGLRDQGVDRDTLDFKGPFQPYSAWIALAFFSVIIVFNGFDSWSPEFDVTNFLTAYLGIPIFFGLYAFWKVFKRTKVIPTSEIDIYSGKSALDSIQWPEKEPSNIFEKFWYWLA
ncbi:hypothetical protein Egran_02055 [Elaphomyces granulatus]|uniref:Amino acid permease/ SLC12A domain-containing protein n=1 Tax=Elaphomyces granulatus TaxID=519963 RepID=A0A232M1J4_9EURO|nr:hypothetical protein Egran_02055 [Elaphomyces granulatus]